MAATKPTQKFNESRLIWERGNIVFLCDICCLETENYCLLEIIYDGNYTPSTRFPYICLVASHVFPDVLWPNWPPDQIPVKKENFC